jgi:hypothetical protein
MVCLHRRWALAACLLALQSTALSAAERPQVQTDLPLLLEEDFESGADRWQPTDRDAWRIEETDAGHIYHQFASTSKYSPPHRSPLNFALRKDLVVGDFVLVARVRSSHADYDHRDACVVFGYQNPAQFYYVHFGKRADDHANQIFVVDQAPRIKISQTSTEGTPWDDEWHWVKIERHVSDGRIAIFFDDMQQPVMTARDDRFQSGQIGIGSFDDTTQWDDIRVYGRRAELPAGDTR